MNITRLKQLRYVLLAVPILFLSLPARAAGTDELNARINALEQQIADLKAMVQEQQQQTASKDEVKAVQQDVSALKSTQYEWKTYDSVVHLGGYGAADFNTASDTFSRAQFSPIFHYSYKDLVMMEAEVEMAIGPEDAPEIDLEYADIDLFLTDHITVTAGKFLTPLGYFIPKQHPSWVNKMPDMPAGFGHDQAAPVSETGVMARGGFRSPVGENAYINYAAYVGNGPHIEMEGDEIDAIAAEGFTNDPDNSKIYGGRIGILPIPNVEIGFSAATGDAAIENEHTRGYHIYDVDLSARWNNFSLRAEWVTQGLDALATSVVPSQWNLEGMYVQGSYRFLPSKFEGVVRYSKNNSPHPELDYDQIAFGVDYNFNSHTIAKMAYEINDGMAGEEFDEDRLLLQLAYGF